MAVVSATERAAVLIEALPYIQRFSGARVVIKYGGNVLADEATSLKRLAEDVMLMHSVGLSPIVVHGGGPQIDATASRLGLGIHFHDGLRVTDEEMLGVVKMVLLGVVNPMMVTAINRYGARAVGISGIDGGVVQVTQRDPELGFVGAIQSVDGAFIERLLAEGLIPVVASLGVDAEGQVYNLNADTLAAAIAAELRADKLVYLTNVAGLFEHAGDPSTLLSVVGVDEVEAMIANGQVAGGMIPKLRSAIEAVSRGVQRVHLLDGRVDHALILEIFSDAGVGTMIVK
ncbi:MAG: acetylglutamate kinase [Ferrimicrobium sp.]